MSTGVRMSGPWRPLTAEAAAALPGQLGVYQVADGDGLVLRIGYAGGRSLFGLRSEVGARVDPSRPDLVFRVEVTMAYLTRWQELLMAHRADHGALPPENEGDPALPRLGRLTPS